MATPGIRAERVQYLWPGCCPSADLFIRCSTYMVVCQKLQGRLANLRGRLPNHKNGCGLIVIRNWDTITKFPYCNLKTLVMGKLGIMKRGCWRLVAVNAAGYDEPQSK